MLKITSTDFKKYKNICDKIILLLNSKGYSSTHDIHIILKILSGLPYSLDTEGHISYKGKFYNSIGELPTTAINDLLCRLEHYSTI